MKIWFGTIIVFLGILWVFSPVIGLSNDLGEEIAYIKVQSSIERLNLAYDRIRALELYEEKQQVKQKTILGYVTCYTNIPELTDSDPNTTASGEKVYVGGVAANGYDFGTQIRIDQTIYTVNDRKNSRYGPEWFDLFVESYQEAVNCGVKEEEIIIL